MNGWLNEWMGGWMDRYRDDRALEIGIGMRLEHSIFVSELGLKFESGILYHQNTIEDKISRYINGLMG